VSNYFKEVCEPEYGTKHSVVGPEIICKLGSGSVIKFGSGFRIQVSSVFNKYKVVEMY
jgi:hypothetical protein